MSLEKYGIILKNNNLILNEPNFDEIFPHSTKCQLDMYNDIFDILNIYDNCTFIEINTDHIWNLPSNLTKFIFLKTLIIEGSRFWDVTEDQIPSSIKILDYYNIHDDFWIRNGKNLYNLECIVIFCNWDWLIYDETIIINFMSAKNPFPIISTLKNIELEFIDGNSPETDNQVFDAVNNHILFEKYKITNIKKYHKVKYEAYICYNISVTLKEF